MSVFIKSLHLKNILSFKDTKLDLQPLNVLIGPNGSGKSNLIDVIALLQAVPGDLAGFLRRNGPTGDWKWKGNSLRKSDGGRLEVVSVIHNPQQPTMPLEYELQLEASGDRLGVMYEGLKNLYPTYNQLRRVYFSRQADGSGFISPTHSVHADLTNETNQMTLNLDAVSSSQSVFNAIRDPLGFSTLSTTASRLSGIKSYRNWYVGRDSPVRNPQRTDGDPNFLAEDFSNLALVVNDLLSRRLEPSLNDYLSRFYESYESIHPRIFGNTIELVVNEAGLGSSLPASRLSDGTIRFIALLAILCHPNPPPLICIEEPEIAMHPDSVDLIAELLRQAAERTQIIVTTHSPWLIGRFSAEPEAVIVCDMDATEGTRLHRLSHKEVEDWFDGDRDLGDIWMSGAIQGVRW